MPITRSSAPKTLKPGVGSSKKRKAPKKKKPVTKRKTGY